MGIISINLKNDSHLNCSLSITDDYHILCATVLGKYRTGSEGNTDGLYLFSKIVSHYFVFEPLVLILDLRELEYSWGNTILKSINFFYEIGRDRDEQNKVSIVIPSQNNKHAIKGLLDIITDGRVILCEDYRDAFDLAATYVREYLE